MKKFGETVNAALDKIPGMDAGAIRKAARVKQERDMWAELVEPAILTHTNGVYVFKDKDGQTEDARLRGRASTRPGSRIARRASEAHARRASSASASTSFR